MGEKEETIQRLPDQLYEAYKLADSYAASTKRTPEALEKIKAQMIMINDMVLKISEQRRGISNDKRRI